MPVMKWYREPLVHFLLIGAALFGIFTLWGGASAPAPSRYHVAITPSLIQNLQVSYQRQNQRLPNDRELAGLIDSYVREEILGREARALGLDQDDPLIRSQLSGRMEEYLQSSAEAAPPSDAQLQAFLEKNAADFRKADGTLPALSEIRAGVQAAYDIARRRETANAAYEKIRAQYTVDIAKAPSASPTGTSAAAAPSPGTSSK